MLYMFTNTYMGVFYNTTVKKITNIIASKFRVLTPQASQHFPHQGLGLSQAAAIER